MSVKSCERMYCDSIMCDTYVHGIGYVCHECQNEFQEQFPNLTTEGEIREKLSEFMDTHKTYSKEMSIRDFFKQYTQ